MPKFFSRKKTFRGQWSPQVTDGPPKSRGSEGRTHTLKDITELTDDQERLTLDQLDCIVPRS